MRRKFTIGQTILANALKPAKYKIINPIQWVELYSNPDTDRMLLISKEILDWDSFINVDKALDFHSGNGLMSFTEAEREFIQEICLLSADEVEKYVPAELASAEIKIVEPNDEGTGDKIKVNSYVLNWWLRTPAKISNRMCVVCGNGQINYDGMDMYAEEVGIRPAMWVRNLDQFECYLKAQNI